MLELEAAASGKVLVIGHRGAMGHAPENTIASFQKGYEMHADIIELDIHLSKDGELVVMHDGDVRRTTKGRGHIKDMTLEEIKSLDAGSHFGSAFKAERVPTLSEVLLWAKEKLPLAIEIKGDPHPTAGIEEKLLGHLREFQMLDRVMVISFHHTSVKRVKELEPSVATGVLFTGRLVNVVEAAKDALADSVRPSWQYWSAELVDEVHDAGLTASTWTVNDEGTMEYLIAMGIDSIGTDYPDRLREVLNRLGRSWRT
jgi:glycerophosphoryl diester phosphodiesterase